MGFLAAVGTCFRKYFTIKGRASRSEYWWWTLFMFAGSMLYSAVTATMFVPQIGANLETLPQGELVRFIGIGSAFWLLTIVPTLTVTVRRLHDTGRSGIWILAPWLINGLIFYGALISMPPQLSALGLKGVDGDPLIGSLLMLAGGVAMLILSIMMLVWMLKGSDPGDNFFGPDPRGDSVSSYGEEYVRSYVPQINRSAAAPATSAGPAKMSSREEISALYQQRVLGKQGG